METIMLYTHRSVRSLVAAAGLVAAAHALTAFGQTVGVGEAPKTELAPASSIDRAADLLAAGKLVQAKSLLVSLSRDGGVNLSDAERQRVFTMLGNANRRIKSLAPIDLSLQTAQDSFEKGDYRTLEHHATAVISSPKATREQ